MQALIFAVEEINSRLDLLPNITLGFLIYDTCAALRRTVEGALWMLSGGGEIIPNYQCQEETRLACIISYTGSTRSIIMTQILDLYRYPQLSYFSTSPSLSSMNQLSSISSNEVQYRGLAQLVTYFGWTWIGLLATDDDYGQVGAQMVKKEIITSGACVAFVENILTGHPKRNAPNIVHVIKKSVVNVVIVLSSPFDFLPVVEELVSQNVTGKTWVASESWSTSAFLLKERFQRVLGGTIGFAIHGGQMLGFGEYLYSLHPSNHLNDGFVNEFWEKVFSCTWNKKDDSNTTRKCTGRENLKTSLIKADLRITFNVYTCVYAIAWALQSLLQCKPGQGPFHHGACADISSLQPWQVHHYVKNVNFHTSDGTHIFFNDKGNSPAIYDILNWQLEATQNLKQVLVGIYNSSAPPEHALMMDNAAIRWNQGDTQVHYHKKYFNDMLK
uniref:Receptor ligand binding region domain-containing protein n=1 Tax=Leptobrachium leishanense TaxID=445787 RepID=A0A8C5MHP9_9ANUR